MEKLFSDFKWENWKNLILFSIAIFLLLQLGFIFVEGRFPVEYGEDFLAFWSAGKNANEKSYAEIYDLNNLRSVQTQELKRLGYLVQKDDPKAPPNPAPVLPIFIVPFQILSKTPSNIGYWIWTIINLAALVGYLLFFIRKISAGVTPQLTGKNILLSLLIFFPVFSNLVEGQVNAFLVVCAGEFIRCSISKKPVRSGMWLAGLLLKPQMLILVIPIIILLKYWKVFLGFIYSSILIISSSLIVSGWSGMETLINLWVGYGGGIPTNAINLMVNWRMVATNLTSLINLSVGWLVAGLGIVLSLLALFFLIKRCPPYGSPHWVLTMFGVFSATLAITWHAHYAMAIVLIPFMAYTYKQKLLPENLIFYWVIFTPIIMFGTQVVSLLVLLVTNTNIYPYQGLLTAISGFILILEILTSILHYSYTDPFNSYPDKVGLTLPDLDVIPSEPFR